MSRFEIFDRIQKTAARILMARDPQPNRTAAYSQALAKGAEIATRNRDALDLRKCIPLDYR